ncbi:MAG: hypothetical protein ACREX4_08580, partial [Gammaproteobacteria bacterium]
TGSADQALKQKTWAIYESQKKQAWTDYEMERRRIWADYDADRARIWKTYKSGRAQVWAAYNAERSRIWNSYNANRTKQNYEAAARYTREAYSTAAQQSREAYGKAAAQSQKAYANAAKQNQDAYACYAAKAKRAYAAYLATTDRDQEDNLKQMEAEVANKCRALPPSPRLACNSPAQSGLEVPDGNPTCEQQWGYYLAKLLVVQQFTAMSRLLDAKEKRAIQQREIIETTANIVGPMWALFKSPDIATKVINTYFDLPQLLFHLIPSSDAKKITVIWADWALNSLQAIAVYYATGVVPTPMLILPGIKLVILINTSWNVGGITIDRWRYLVAQDYLIDYFKYGGDLRSIARKYGLPPASTRYNIIDTIARNTVTPSWRMRFPLADTESTVSYYESFIKKFVELCMNGQCQTAKQ